MKAHSIHTVLFSLVSGFAGTAWAQAAPEQPSAPAPAPAAAAAPDPAAQAQPAAPVYVPAQGAPATQEAAPPQPVQPYYAAPPPVEEAKPGARLHDGFYLRMSLGLGSGSATEKITGGSLNYPEIKFSGMAMMFDILLGGSPVPGFVLGGGLVSHRILNPKVKAGGTEVSTTSSDLSLNLTTIGLFTAIYPDPKSGFNIHALVGYGVASLSNGDSTSTDNPAGLSVMGGVGYDFWVSDQWSLGPDLRVAYANTTYSADGIENKVSIFVPTLSFTATYH